MRINNIEIEHSSLGEENAPPLLFLHGWGVGRDVYIPLLKALSERYRVYAPDLPGFGKSGEPPTPWDTADYAQFVVDYCAFCDISPAVCIGHSNGGRILIHMLSRNMLTPKKAVLLNSAGLKNKRSCKTWLKIFAYKTGKLFLKPFPKALAKFAKNKGSADYQSASPAMKTTMSNLLSADLTPDLCKISVSTLLIWGEGDTATPLSDGKKMENQIPDAGLCVLQGGHWAFLEQLPQTLDILKAFI